MAKDIQALRETVAEQQQQMEAQRQQTDRVEVPASAIAGRYAAGSARLPRRCRAAPNRRSQQRPRLSSQPRTLNALQARLLPAPPKQRVALAVVERRAVRRRRQEDQCAARLHGALLRLSGDIRLRGEDIFQDCPACVTRNRARLRVRFGVDGRLNENFMGGFALATGSLRRPDFRERDLQRLLRPQDHQGLTAATSLSIRWPPDGSPSPAANSPTPGLAHRSPSIPTSTLKASTRNSPGTWKTPFLKNFTVQGMQLLYNEVAKGDRFLRYRR